MQVKTTLGYSLWVPHFLRGSDNDQNRPDINLIFRDNYNYNPLAFLFNLFQKTENASTERNKTFTLKTYICRENDSKIYWLPVENHPLQKAVSGSTPFFLQYLAARPSIFQRGPSQTVRAEA